MTARKRRTLLYAPADRPDSVESALETDADAVILDLESTVAEGDKDEARDALAEYFAEFDFGDTETVVRINDLRSDRWLADVRAGVAAGADTIRLPKVEEPWEVRTAVETSGQIADLTPEFLLQLETPRGVMNGENIARTCADLPLVTGIGIGIGDYTKSLGLDDHTTELRTFLLNRVAALAAAGEMDPLAYVHKDPETLREAAETARSLGHVGQPISHEVDGEAFVSILHDVYGE